MLINSPYTCSMYSLIKLGEFFGSKANISDELIIPIIMGLSVFLWLLQKVLSFLS